MEHEILDDGFQQEPHPPRQVRYAGFGIRLGAALIDSLVLVPLFFLNNHNATVIKSLPLMLFLTVLGAMYKPWLEWQKSATLGKMAAGIKVVDENYNDIELNHALTRYLPWVISAVLNLAINFSIYQMPEFQEVDTFIGIGELVQDSSYQYVNQAYSFIFMLLVGSLIIDVKKQGFHDKHAGTYVIYDSP